MLLRRSQGAPLSVRCILSHLRSSQSTIIPPESFAHIHRIQTLELSLDRSATTSSYLSLIGAVEAPSLRILRIHSEAINDDCFPCHAWSMPCLERLEICASLSGFWRPFLRPSLRHLSLGSSTKEHSYTRTPSNAEETLPLLDVLHNLPLLQSLVLHLDMYTGTLESSMAPQISLPELRLLEITGHLGHCVDVLSRLVVPDCAAIVIDGTKNCSRRDPRYFGAEAAHVAFVLKNVLDNPPLPTYDTTHARELLAISLSVEDSSILRLRGWVTGENASLAFRDRGSKPIIDITVPCRESQSHLKAVLSLLSLRRVVSLQIGPMDLLGPFGSPSTVIPWFRVFAQLRDVSFLRVCALKDPAFWIGLLLPHESVDGGLRFPALTTLELVDVKFACPPADTGLDNRRRRSDVLCSELTYANLSGQPVDFLRCMVSRYKKSGNRLRKVAIERAKNFREHDGLSLGEVREAVAAVIEWDGKEEFVDVDPPQTRVAGRSFRPACPERA
ncbi:hypothetical protein BC835DRAFT_854725 [Cytidiella melzeri]|nr:hypothetical protein BC835DRAFT_854725 [Cytidiella melzeri]